MVLAALALAGTACGGEAPPPAPTKHVDTPSWADVFDGTPDLYAVLRPRALKRDALYGTFFKTLMRAAQARGIAPGDSIVQAIEGADELILGSSKGVDAALVLRGVPASIDPTRVVDRDGKLLFGLVSDRTKVAEYELRDRSSMAAGDGALFVLPDRTWTFALGEARTRARASFAKPLNRPKPEVDADALLVLRVAGGMAHALDGHPRFGVLGKKLASALVSLKPGRGGVVLGLNYEDAAATAWAEMHAKRIVDELSKEARTAWLKDAKVAYEGNTVFVRVAVPPRLLEELPTASGADFGL